MPRVTIIYLNEICSLHACRAAQEQHVNNSSQVPNNDKSKEATVIDISEGERTCKVALTKERSRFKFKEGIVINN